MSEEGGKHRYKVDTSDGRSAIVHADYSSIENGDLMFWNYWTTGRGGDQTMVAGFAVNIWTEFSRVSHDYVEPSPEIRMKIVAPAPTFEEMARAVEITTDAVTNDYYDEPAYRVAKWHLHLKFWRRRPCLGGPIRFGWTADVESFSELSNGQPHKVTMTSKQVRRKRAIGLIK